MGSPAKKTALRSNLSKLQEKYLTEHTYALIQGLVHRYNFWLTKYKSLNYIIKSLRKVHGRSYRLGD
jgi:hypothetical protein